MARAGQLFFLAMANLGDEPGVEVTPQRLADGCFRLLIQSSRVEGTIAQIRGRARLIEHALAAPDVLHCDRWEWVDALRAATRRLSERAATAEHTTPNLAPPSHFTVAGASISRQYDGDILPPERIARVPAPMFRLFPGNANVPEHIDEEAPTTPRSESREGHA